MSAEIVFSRTLTEANVAKHELLKGDLAGNSHAETTAGKRDVYFSARHIVTQLSEAATDRRTANCGQPIILEKGKTPFETLKQRLPLKL